MSKTYTVKLNIHDHVDITEVKGAELRCDGYRDCILDKDGEVVASYNSNIVISIIKKEK